MRRSGPFRAQARRWRGAEAMRGRTRRAGARRRPSAAASAREPTPCSRERPRPSWSRTAGAAAAASSGSAAMRHGEPSAPRPRESRARRPGRRAVASAPASARREAGAPRARAATSATISSAPTPPCRKPRPATIMVSTTSHCVTGIAGRQPLSPPTGSRRESAMRRIAPPCGRKPARRALLGLERHRVGDEAAAGPERVQAASNTPGCGDAAADEDRVRGGQAGERLGRRARRRRRGPARRGGAHCGAMRSARSGRSFDGDGAVAADGAASTRCRSSRRPRRCPTGVRPARGARALRGSARGSPPW